MKANYHHKLISILLFLLGFSFSVAYAQQEEDSPTLLELKYYLPVNNVPYVKVISKKKVGRKFEPVKGITVNVYLTEIADNNLLGKITTTSNGEGRVAFPAAVKDIWDALDEFTIVAASVPKGNEDVLDAEIILRKAILVMDTTNDDDVRTVSAQLKEKRGEEWVAIPEIEMKLRIKRLLGNLTVGDDEIYTAGEDGTASASFEKDSMPGDEKGNIILVARVDDNDVYGNLAVEKTVPWGKPVQVKAFVWQRTLWSTGGRAPFWLLILAGGIMIGVWGTIIYLVMQMFKIKKMGKIIIPETITV